MVKCVNCDGYGVRYGVDGGNPTHCMTCGRLAKLKGLRKKGCCISDNCYNDARFRQLEPGSPLIYCTQCANHSDNADKDLTNGNSSCPHVLDNGKICGQVGSRKIVENGKTYRYCAQHGALKGLVDTIHAKCTICKNTEPTFILDSNTKSTKPTHCKPCAKNSKEPYHDVRHKLCEECIRLELKEKSRPTFGLEKGKPTHCEKHKSDEMFDVCNKMCETCEQKEPPIRIRACIRDDNNKLKYCYYCNPKLEEILAERAKLIKPKGCTFEGCTVLNPSFGLLWKQPLRCKSHKGDMNNVVSKKCADATCEKFRCYGSEWRKPTHCAEHGRPLNLVNVISKRCKECNIIASYGIDWQKPTHCMEHGSQLNMKNVVSKTCKEKDCGTRPIFGFEGGSPEYCGDHVEKGMIDLTHIKCFEDECDKRACFGTEINAPEYCIAHKSDYMQDVVHTKCENCDKRPSFGIELGNPTHCVAHKFDVMIDVVSKRCEQDGCIKQASFNYIDELAKYCGQHKSADMVNIRATYCITEDCNIQASIIRYKGYCFSCFCQHPDYKNEPIIRNYKIKESAIMRSISELIETPIICDKIINGGCSKRRPDGLIQLDGRNIIIEIDENQHKNLGYENEEIRISEIYNDLNQAPLTIIRFNPDGYNRISNGLFTKNANGIVEVIHPERYANAIKELIQVIEDAIKNNPVGNISIIKLRFDSL